MKKLSDFFDSVKAWFSRLWQKIQNSKGKNWILATISVFSIVIILVGGYLLLQSNFFKKLLNKNENKWTPYTEVNALPHGKQTYQISGSTSGAPKITEAIVDPIDPAKGAPEVYTLKVNEPNGKNITNVEVNVLTDNKGEKISLQRIDGTEKDGTWQGALTLTDTYETKYAAVLTAKNTDNKVQTVTLTFR